MLRSLAALAMSQNYKETLNLPRTDFPMKANLAAREPEMLKMWEETRLYQQIQKSREDRQLFVLHDGPPFANGDVHMGTALNKILKDLVVRSQTMLGRRAPYVPGWDCHGLPIEYKVVKESRALSPPEIRSRNPACVCGVCRGRSRLSIEEAGLLEHRCADRARRSRSGIPGARRHDRLRQIPDHKRRIGRQSEHRYLDNYAVDFAG